MSHPDGLPDLFLDRSLGRVQVPALLAAGLRLVTLAEHYGIPADEAVDDVTWWRPPVRRAGLFMKDDAIRRHRVEQEAPIAHRVRAFCVTRQDLRAAGIAERFLVNLNAITRACAEPGPFVYAVHTTRIERLRIT